MYSILMDLAVDGFSVGILSCPRNSHKENCWQRRFVDEKVGEFLFLMLWASETKFCSPPSYWGPCKSFSSPKTSLHKTKETICMTRHAWHWENVFVWDLSELGVQNKYRIIQYKYMIWVCMDNAPLEKCTVEMWCFQTNVFFTFLCWTRWDLDLQYIYIFMPLRSLKMKSKYQRLEMFS